jgi:hypothetical protein
LHCDAVRLFSNCLTRFARLAKIGANADRRPKQLNGSLENCTFVASLFLSAGLTRPMSGVGIVFP